MSHRTDYLVIGAGAAGLAFADELLHGDERAHLTIVERRTVPGGHWNDAYPFVRLHQPALFYGVNSEPLGSGGRDLASKPEMLAYFARVVEKLEATGRLEVLWGHEYVGDGVVRPLDAPDGPRTIVPQRRTVDATYAQVTVPSTTPPRYRLEDGVRVRPVNAIATVPDDVDRFVVVGAGKTGMDAVLHLLEAGVEPAAIQWITPRDAWLIDRATTFPEAFIDSIRDQLGVLAEASSLDALLDGLEDVGYLCRLHPEPRPTAFRCATVDQRELAQLRRVEDVVRLGRIQRITKTTIHLARGEVPVAPRTLFVDCTADGLLRRPAKPVFDGDRITLQPVIMCQPTYSAAIVALAELRGGTDARRNACCVPVPHPSQPSDLVGAMHDTMGNMDALMRRWLPWMMRARLNAGAHCGVWKNLAFLFRSYRLAQRAQANLAQLSTAVPA